MKGIVLAGNIHQYTNWCRENNEMPRDWVYGESRERVLGIHNKKIVLTGQYWLNKVYKSAEFNYLIRDNELINSTPKTNG